jgi:hypothetical protein
MAFALKMKRLVLPLRIASKKGLPQKVLLPGFYDVPKLKVTPSAMLDCRFVDKKSLASRFINLYFIVLNEAVVRVRGLTGV